MIVNFPEHTGLSPRKLLPYDQLCIKYFYAVNRGGRKGFASLESRLLGYCDSREDLDLCYSSGRFLSKCKITQVKEG